MSNPSALAQQFEQIVGKEHITDKEDLVARYQVAGVRPSAVVAPGSPDEVTAVINLGAQADLVIVPWGGGTMIERGFAPVRYDLALSLSRLREVVDFDVANLTVTAQAGLTLAELQGQLRQAHQFLPLNPPLPTQATIGGVVAANASGPGRFRYGAARDLVLGMRVALANGQVIHLGGKTVKNVAGYDLSKVFIGSYGTLGVITEVTFRLLPCPQARRALKATFEGMDMALNWAAQVMDSELLPACLTVMNPLATQWAFGNDAVAADYTLIVGLDGSAETVERQVRQMSASLRSVGACSVTLLEGAARDSALDSVRDFVPSALSDVRATAFTANIPLSATTQFASEVEEASVRLGLKLGCVVAADTGTVICLAEGADEDRLAEVYGQSVVTAAQLGGHCVLDRAAPELRRRVAVWGEPRDDWKLAKVLKGQFDPGGLFNRGRFVGGI